MGLRIRVFAPEDTDRVIELWQACGLTRPWNDPRADIARKLTVQPELFLVAEDVDPDAGLDPDGAAAASRVVGSVMAGYDGHRGWLYYLASDPARRCEGIGRLLTAEAEARLLAMGCPKVQLMVRAENEAVIAFYDALGYEGNDVLVRGKRLIEDRG
ncbi:MAG: GNAT family acetyltransferase [Actinobacteria bacterium]|nr:GNAT family acetyltransferase [Actinomycetota bacterium]